ncbi:hypothetical protein ACWFR5_02555 [Streptomyces sp. NPDC055092]
MQHLFLGESELELLLDDGEGPGVRRVPGVLVGDARRLQSRGAHQIWT